MKQAWDNFRKSCYAHGNGFTRAGYQNRPSTRPSWNRRPNDAPEFLKGLKQFLSCGEALGKSELYRADALELTAQYLGFRVDSCLRVALRAHRAGDAQTRDKYSHQALQLMSDIDSMLASHPLDRLVRWVEFARAWGDSSAEKDYYEADAKRQITTWGGPVLSEYASKVWHGLIRDYYRARWELFFQQLSRGEKSDVTALEEHWITTPTASPANFRSKDPIAEMKEMIAKGEALEREIAAIPKAKENLGIAVGKPARASDSQTRDTGPEKAVDGIAELDSYWGSGAHPQWLEIDLQQPTKIARVRVFPYWDGSRAYQYTVEASDDQKNWRTIADRSSNTQPATEDGDTIDLHDPITARYVRVTMLHNSANAGVHLVEVQVFAP
jgi:alpha-N-acetylglucosaminidase